MGVWFLMLAVNALFPVIMLLAGCLFMKKPPKKINAVIGYRTALSMKNEDTWVFAHHQAGAFWWKWGKITAVSVAVLMLVLLRMDEKVTAIVGTILMFLQLIPVLAVIPSTEKALEKTFDRNGCRKHDQ